MLHIGDFICLYCENTCGYVYSDNSSSTNDGLFVYNEQDRDKPEKIQNIEAVMFQISTQNRYKLTKKYRNLLDIYGRNPDREDLKTLLQNAKASSLAELQDNRQEQKRLQGKRLKYGEIIQLRHVFSNRYIKVSVTDTSSVDKDKLKVHLHTYGTKNAQFKILPSYKVKVEGEQIENLDQVVFESIKSPGSYLNASEPYQVSPDTHSSEVNLATTKARFTIIQHSSRDPNDPLVDRYLRASSVVQLFHRDLEAYLVAEGVFGQSPAEDVHLRIREQNHADTRTLYPPRSGFTYWQVESEKTIVDGTPITWEQKVRLRHMTTRRYLCVEEGNSFGLVEGNTSPNTVFRLHSLVQNVDSEEVLLGNHARVEHPLTETWLHAENEDTYPRRRLTSKEGTSMDSLQWDKARLAKVSWMTRRPYQDALTIQKVDTADSLNFNFVAGMVPFIRNIVPQITKVKKLTTKTVLSICKSLEELDDFLVVNGKAEKNRQKLLRNLNVLDLLIDVLKSSLLKQSDVKRIYRIYRSIYRVLHTFVKGQSRKNALYLARYIPFFLSQLGLEGGVGVQCCKMLIDLIMENRQIVDRITPEHLDIFMDILRKHKKHQFLDLLSVLCICNRVAMPNNQLRIATTLLSNDVDVLFHIEIRSNVSDAIGDELCISTDGRKTWVPLHKFAYKNYSGYSEENVVFLEHQLELYRNLSYLRDEAVTTVMKTGRQLFSWKVLFLGASSRTLPGSLRATLLDVLTSFYIDYGRECSCTHTEPSNYIYHDIDSTKANRGRLNETPSDVEERFPGLWEWMLHVLDDNPFMIATPVSNSIFLRQVLRLLECLIKYGHLNAEKDLQDLLPLITRLIDGHNDTPFPPGRGSGLSDYTSFEKHHILKFRSEQRFKKSDTQEAIVQAKIQALKVIDLIFKRTFNRRLQYVLSLFKYTIEKDIAAHGAGRGMKNLFYDLIRRDLEHDDFGAGLVARHLRRPMLHRKMEKHLNRIRDSTVYVDKRFPELLYDLTSYESDELVMKALGVLHHSFSSEAKVLETARRCQVMTSPEMIGLHQQTAEQISRIERLFQSKLNADQATEITQLLDRLNRVCYKSDELSLPSIVAQNILVNNGVFGILFEMILQDVDHTLKEQSDQAIRILASGLGLLRSVAFRNSYVQDIIFKNLDRLMNVMHCGSEWSSLLIHVFHGSINRCLKVHPHHIQQIVRKAGWFQEKAPEVLDLLRHLVKCSSVVIKRNQKLVLRTLMNQFRSAAYVMDLSPSERYDIAKGLKGPSHHKYLVALVDLLATCAEGQMRYAESICQSLMSVEELFRILNSKDICLSLKGSFARYLIWGYLRTGRSAVDDGVDQLNHSRDIWVHFNAIRKHLSPAIISKLNQWIKEETPDPRPHSLRKALQKENIEGFGAVQYALDGGLLLIQTFVSKFYDPDPELDSNEGILLLQLTKRILPFAQTCLSFATEVGEVRIIEETVSTLLRKLGKRSKITEELHDQGELTKELVQLMEAMKTTGPEDNEEEDVNDRFSRFASNFLAYTSDGKTVASVLGISKRWAKKAEYVKSDEEARLPLEPVFQLHVQCFMTSNKNPSERYRRALKLIDQLEVSSRRYKQTAEPEQEEVDIRSLQILRALIYNQVVLLPDNWHENSSKFGTTLKTVTSIQDTFCEYDIIKKVMPLLARQNQHLKKEVLALMDMMLFNANKAVQRSLLKYFSGTTEEMFFMYVRQCLLLATSALKERRSLEHQRRQKQRWKEMKEAQYKDREAKALEAQEHEKASEMAVDITQKRRLQPYLRWIASHKMVRNKDIRMVEMEDPDNMALIDDGMTQDETTDNPEEDVGLIFRVIGGLCDGQNRELQDYLREQPDNVRTVNLVSELCQFLGAHYSTTLDSESISLITLVFGTLNEICQGNQANRTVLVNNKIVDYINFLLRIGRVDGCSVDQVIELQAMVGHLLRSLTEENSPEAHVLTKEIRDTLDLPALFNIMTSCRTLYQDKTANAEHLICGQEKPKQTGMALFQKREHKHIRDSANEVGLTLYLVIARLRDIDPSVDKLALTDPCVKKAHRAYKEQCLSIELIKDGHLQRAHFPVHNKEILRETLVMQIKWNIDRSSPSAKLRDLVRWSRDIMADIDYQKMIRGNPITKQLAARWAIWNYLCILISMAIQIIMLSTWKSPLTVDQVDENATALPPEMYTFDPLVSWKDYNITMKILSISHNCCCVMLVGCYFMLKHPALPRFTLLRALYARCCRRKKGDDKSKVQPSHQHKSRLAVGLIGPETIYYMLLMASSFAGTFVHVYFFAFHLLNIVANVELLKGVVRAVTLNGKSLLWVAFMGLIIIYIYSIIAFAFFRASFTPDEELYCGSLYECTVTMLRYGVVGDISENYRLHPLQNDFAHFTSLTIFQVTFFILFTTIGLNIIFGIIVDTFSELRDLKWMAEKDMRDSCFICGIDNHVFENSGQGFDHHVRNEHNMWAYILYFIHLNEVKDTDYTALDMHVSKMFHADQLEFFPLNRSLSLQNLGDDEQETRFDDLLTAINDMNKTYRVQEAHNRKLAEKRRQQQWRRLVRRSGKESSEGGGRSIDVGEESVLSSEADGPFTPAVPAEVTVQRYPEDDSENDSEDDSEDDGANVKGSQDESNV